ncbi:hypothetical protein C8N24_0664 [Solirubrobacter pauli]|uniref:Uncharacterized protein n=1 Tax=Solirubrobacter pauli TaxID=166793 RepID=A0A660L8K9_9ACTN|nr:hypothetical protein [Solirubrobacter pauli]RKQ90849.1 hypothetical protein C8N24_0664 [Solirubrobacter pauli]
MPDLQAPPTAAPSLFDVTTTAPADPAGTLVRVPLDDIRLAPNARHDIAPNGIERLARMLMSMGQLVPGIGHRPAGQPVVLYAGQRRLLAARASHDLAVNGLQPVRSLIVLLLDHAPSRDEIRRIQAQENQREDLTLADQQAQFADCWAARAGLHESDRIGAVCADLGIGPVKAHNLRRQLTLPEPIRARVADRPGERQISVTLANRLADMHEIAPELTEGVARRISTSDLHDAALRDLGAFVHRTLVEDETTYAVRIDDGALLDAHSQITLARQHLTDAGRRAIAHAFRCDLDELDSELDTLQTRAKSTHASLRVDSALRERARTGRYAYVHERGADFAAGIWVIDPAFLLDAVRQSVADSDDTPPVSNPAYFAGAHLDAPDLRAALADEKARRHDERQRHADAVRTNLGLGHDLRAGLIDPSPAQLDALRTIVCRLLSREYRDVLAYGAGWTDPDRQRPVGESGRHEPMAVDAIVDAELGRALAEPDSLRGIAALVARFAAAFVLDPDGVTRTKALGRERMSRKLEEVLPGGDDPLREALWAFLRPMLSPRLAALHRETFVTDPTERSTVDLDAHRADTSLDELELDEPSAA